jgi:hypothetical protein
MSFLISLTSSPTTGLTFTNEVANHNHHTGGDKTHENTIVTLFALATMLLGASRSSAFSVPEGAWTFSGASDLCVRLLVCKQNKLVRQGSHKVNHTILTLFPPFFGIFDFKSARVVAGWWASDRKQTLSVPSYQLRTNDRTTHFLRSLLRP